MIRSHIGSIQECGMVLKLERFSHLSGRSFGLGSPIELEILSETFKAIITTLCIASNHSIPTTNIVHTLKTPTQLL